jgi:hypothetical protein
MPENDVPNARAVRLKCNLLRLADKEQDPSIKTHLKKLAAFTRIVFEGLTSGEVKAKLYDCFEEFFDGEEASPLTKNDLSDMTGLPRTLIDPMLEKMLAAGEILSEVRIPDYHQPGDHSEESFTINPAAKHRMIRTVGPRFTPAAPRPSTWGARGRKREISNIVMVPELPQEAFTNA